MQISMDYELRYFDGINGLIGFCGMQLSDKYATIMFLKESKTSLDFYLFDFNSDSFAFPLL